MRSAWSSGSGSSRERLVEGLAFEILHDEELTGASAGGVRIRRFADVVQRADVRMRLSAAMARASRSNRWRESGIGRNGRRQDLDRDGAIEPDVAGLVDLAHPAGAEERDDLVGSEPRARVQLVTRPPRDLISPSIVRRGRASAGTEGGDPRARAPPLTCRAS